MKSLKLLIIAASAVAALAVGLGAHAGGASATQEAAASQPAGG